MKVSAINVNNRFIAFKSGTSPSKSSVPVQHTETQNKENKKFFRFVLSLALGAAALLGTGFILAKKGISARSSREVQNIYSRSRVSTVTNVAPPAPSITSVSPAQPVSVPAIISEVPSVSAVPLPSVQTSSGIKQPEFLYHMTGFESYESILRDGIIKKSNPMLGDGVFLSNISDLKYKYPKNVIIRMLNWYGNGPSKKVVLIKIPVNDEIIQPNLKWRQINYGENASRVKSDIWNSFNDFSSKNLEELHSEPIEYLCEKAIPISSIESAKIVNLRDLNPNSIVPDFWRKIYTSD